MSAARTWLGAGLFLAVLGSAQRSTVAAKPKETPLAPVSIHLMVIEATKTSTVFDPGLAKLRSSIVGYTGAHLLDDLEVRVEQHKPMAFDILNHSQKLKLTVKKAEPNGLIVLQVAIDAFKFAANVTHRRSGSTVVVAHNTSANTGLFLAITPTLEVPAAGIAGHSGSMAPDASAGAQH